ncbi:MAG: hypothetical protein AAF446_08235 [Pseudomonadota bacterium]
MFKHKNVLSAAIQLALAAGIVQSAHAQFPGEINVSDLDGSNGMVFEGGLVIGNSGYSVSRAGDINGDGMDDLIIGGLIRNNPPGFRVHDSGPIVEPSDPSYVVFGSQSTLPSPFLLSGLDGSNGFIINGEMPDDSAGFSVDGAGDFNGDGIDDLIIGAPAPFNSIFAESAGRSYIVFGSDNGFTSPFELSSLDGSNGIAIDGEANDDYFGFSVSAAGDINGDNMDDVIIGANSADPNGDFSGRSYVIFGSNSPQPNPFMLSNLNGSNGFVLNGENNGDLSGSSVSAAGDVNHDGIDDLIIGAQSADPNGTSSGRSYVVYGSNSTWPASFELSSLNGFNGFKINGTGVFSLSGVSVSGAGDVNADGIHDVIIGAPNPALNALDPGASYVVFGSDTGFPPTLELSSLNGNNGFLIVGETITDRTGISVSGAGDINGDGIDDLIIGASTGDTSAENAGRSYVVFGSASGFDSPFQLSGLDGSNGFKVNGETLEDRSGYSVSAAGDFNGDGVDDLIIGAPRFGSIGYSRDVGRSYVIFGRASLDVSVRKTNRQAYVQTLQSVTWQIDVENDSALEVIGIRVIDTLPSTVDGLNATWNCMGFNGASCPAASGTGDLDETVNLPARSRLRYQLTAQVLAAESLIVSNTVAVSLPLGLTDINSANNTATDSDPVGLFSDQFEDES